MRLLLPVGAAIALLLGAGACNPGLTEKEVRAIVRAEVAAAIAEVKGVAVTEALPATIRAERFVVLDGQGRERAILGYAADMEGPYLSFLGRDGTQRLTLYHFYRIGGVTGGLIVMDHLKEKRVYISYFGQEDGGGGEGLAYVVVGGKEQGARAYLSVDEGKPRFAAVDRYNTLIWGSP